MATQRKTIGHIGERVVARKLRNEGYDIIEFNYRKPWGEIDIVTRKTGEYHFVEVKTVQRDLESNVFHETYGAEDNIHPEKIRRLERAIVSYCEEKGIGGAWTLHCALVELDISRRKARIRIIKDIY